MKILLRFFWTSMLPALMTSNIVAQERNYSIDYLTIDSGLPQNEVTSIIQDKKGFLWFGTRGGLARYDGYNMKVFQYDPRSGNSLSNNSIETMFEDTRGNIWIGTKSGGLNRFDPQTERFQIYQSIADDPHTLSGNRVVSLQEDNSNNLWVGTWKTGLNHLDVKTGKFTRLLAGESILCMKATADKTIWFSADSKIYKIKPGSDEIQLVTAVQPGVDLTSLVIDEDRNILWFGGWGTGLRMYDPDGVAENSTLLHDASNEQSISSNAIYSLLVDDQKQLWCGYWGGGLNVIDRQGRIRKFTLTGPSGQSNPDYDIVLSIFQDRLGTIWVGTDGGGVCKIQETKNFFQTITPGNSALSNGHILGLMEDSNNILWIGTKAGGVNTFQHGQVRPHPEIFISANKRSSDIVYTVYEDRNKDIWFGTSAGLYKLTSFRNHRIRAKKFPFAPAEIVDRKVLAVLMDSQGRFWAGTQQHGLYRSVDITTPAPAFNNYQASPTDTCSIAENRVSCLYEDSRQNIWIGTYKGLYLYNEQDDCFKGLHHVHGDPNSLSNDIINCITEDDAGNIWVGTPGGLNLVANHNGKLSARYFTKKDGLPNDYINAILPDSDQHLWISSNAGIFQFNPKNRLIKIFTTRDGLQSNAFSEGAACKGTNGMMYFGGIHGLNGFQPGRVPPPVQSPLAFVSLKVMNREINPGDTVNRRVVLKRSITHSDEVVLDHLARVFSIEVASMDFTSPEKNQFSFRLDGFDDDWVDAGHNRTTTYTNLQPGLYTLHARASDAGNVWNDQLISLNIRILPAPWLTGWAYLGYATILLLIAAAITREIKKRIELKNELHAAQVVHAKTQLEQLKEKEISEIKLRFFTNVSHELRTPLTLIMSPLEEILAANSVPVELREKLSLMNRHTNKLLSLVNQLLDFRKTESGNMQLFIERTEVVKYVRDIFETFKHVSARRQIAYQFQSDLDHLYIEIDKNKLEIAVTNVLANAFKYSSDKSEITCHLSIEKNATDKKIYCVIQVKDTGRGIPPDVLDKIFDLYYQVSLTESMKVEGSGIGLSLVKEVVHAHGGEVFAASETGKGSVFTIRVPIKQSPALRIVSASRDLPTHPDIEDAAAVETKQVEMPNDADKPVLLVVEDTEDVRTYLADLLARSYVVLTAPTAETALKIAGCRIPDIIISDVMMPGMDGFEFCQRIKTNERTSHIPVILLTARITPENELLGLNNGADDYVKKPFSPAILHARIQRQLDARKQLKEYYSRKVTLQPTNIEITSYDETFLKRAMSFIEDNLLNPHFNNDCLEKELGMSHSTLYRKIKALTGLSISEFVRSIRLKRAAQLLETGSVSIAEAAFQTGFSEIKYFRTYFKNQFGCLPSEYCKSRKNASENRPHARDV